MQLDDWVLRLRVPSGAGPHPVTLLLHGWTGDENAMWIFASKLPKDHLLIAPRALYPASMGGYSWYPMRSQEGWPRLADFRPAVAALIQLIERWPEPPAVDLTALRLAGFSQGAALAYTFAILHPERVRALAGLAGFLPEDAAAHLSPGHFAGLPVYISHGTRDQLVPVERARQAVDHLQGAGAQVVYCESDAGHKLSAECFRGMEAFFQDV